MIPQKRLRPGNNLGLSRWKTLILAAILLGIVGGVYTYWKKSPKADAVSGTKFSVIKGPLEINVLEGGSIESREKQEIKCEVQGETKILKIVEEGYQITPADVDNQLVLIELDSKKLLDAQVSQELDYQNALSAYTEAKESYDIQVNQNESDLKATELAATFARMDLEKYLGEALATEIVKKIDAQHAEYLEKEKELKAKAEKEENNGDLKPRKKKHKKQDNEAPQEGIADPAREQNPDREEEEGEENSDPGEDESSSMDREDIASASLPPPVLPSSLPAIDMLNIADPDKLGDGEAMQKIRQLESDQILANQSLGIAKTKLDGTKRLFEKEFVTKTQLDNDEFAHRQKEVSLQTTETNQNLFLKYEFPKQAQKLVSGYDEALRGLERMRKQAVSRLAQAEARRASAQARYVLQRKKRNEINEQITKCTIRATRPGLIIYGNGERSWRSDIIEEGASVRERQVLITIPDTSAMDMKVQIHESFVQKIAEGQSARIRVDAFPSQRLTGKVHRISVLPDAQNRWMNPDLKVYTTIIQVDGQYNWLKPGMSAEAEIIIDTLADVVQVPLQAVTLDKNEQVCYVVTALGAERRVVETGLFGTAMIEIKKGVAPGDVVLLRAPESNTQGEGEGGTSAQDGKKDDKGPHKDSDEKKPPKDGK